MPNLYKTILYFMLKIAFNTLTHILTDSVTYHTQTLFAPVYKPGESHRSSTTPNSSKIPKFPLNTNTKTATRNKLVQQPWTILCGNAKSVRRRLNATTIYTHYTSTHKLTNQVELSHQSRFKHIWDL